jgi:hypothetical protein
MNELPDHLKRSCSVISNLPIQNRVKNELLKLINTKYCEPQSIYFEDNVSVQYPRNYCIINVFCKINNKNYKFIVSNSFPFTPPKIEIQSKPYSYYLNFYSIKFKDLYFKHRGLPCFCCVTKTCVTNWSPSITFIDIIDETIQYHNECREISHMVIVNVIKRKYLIDDIDIISWLYI